MKKSSLRRPIIPPKEVENKKVDGTPDGFGKFEESLKGWQLSGEGSLYFLDEYAQKARVNKFIALDHLILIMAQEEANSEALPILWKRYQLDRRGPKQLAFATFRNRVEIWFCLLYRWIGFGIKGNRAGLEAVKLLPTFEEDGVKYVKLDELKEYLKSIQEEYKIGLQLPKRLFGEEKREERTAFGDTQIPKEFSHSPDYRTVNWKGIQFTLTSKQAQVIQMLWEAHKAGLPGLGKDRILEDVSGGSRFKDIFKSNPEAYKALIKQGERRGIYRLNM